MSQIDKYGDHVRIIYKGAGEWANGDDVIVERRVKNEWVRVASFNSMSNDWAYSEAAAIARKTQHQMAQLQAEARP